ncbi:hypothetical protein ACFQAT_02075 [Undibacterium arcticum]|uniref:Transmembrane protein n=1 Tax=Undibacterium arcticum TaxID=1762892 RepID=A0ABV7F6S4_9BURK
MPKNSLALHPRALLRATGRSVLAVSACTLLLLACSPKFDWREVHGKDAPFVVVLPAKPSSIARQINLNGTTVTMQMTAAEVDGVTFAIGTAELPDAAKAQAALPAMKKALVSNIKGTVKSESSAAAAQGAPGGKRQTSSLSIEAEGVRGATAEPTLLIARFIAQDQRIYQLIVIGKPQAVSRDAVDTFLTSFKLN